MDTDMKMHTWFGTVLVVFLIALICQPVNLFARPGGGRPGGGARPSGGSRPSAPSRPSPSARPAPSRPSPSRGPHRVVYAICQAGSRIAAITER